MSQPYQTTHFNRNYWSPYSNRGVRRRPKRGNGCYRNLSSHRYQDGRPWTYNKRKNKRVQRSPSPFSGTEEHTLKTIQKTSEMIKRKLLLPDENDESEAVAVQENDKNDVNQSVLDSPSGRVFKKKTNLSSKPLQYSAQEIHEKILNHISNLKHGRKVTLICGVSSGYDNAIEQIQKKRRLEISKVLREMCSNQSVENYDAKINSIIPDFGLKIEDLPFEVIKELSNALDLDADNFPLLEFDGGIEDSSKGVSDHEIFNSPIVEIKSEANDSPMIEIKSEINDVNILSEMETHEETSYELDNRLTNAENNNDKKKNSQHIKVESTDDSFMFSTLKESIAIQTDALVQIHSTVQTDTFENKIQEVANLKDAVDVMLEIDKEIARLTELRQSIFLQLQKQETEISSKQIIPKVNGPKKKIIKIKKHKKTKKSLCCRYEKPLEFGDLKEKVLVMQIFEKTILAGCESGVLLFIDTKTGLIERLKVTTVSITCLAVWTNSDKQHQLYVGAFDTTLYNYSYPSKRLEHSLSIGENVQCVEIAWDLIFVGTNKGALKRYDTKGAAFEFEERISDCSIFVLKATKEGTRQVLIVGSRNSPVTVRDAMSGLHLRTMTDSINPTVYCLILENSMVYCGTSNNDLLVFRFHDGCLLRKHQATFAKGISCMKIVENLLYASCHNGNIYVYDATSQTYIGTIEGPGGVILSMEIISNMVVVGTMSLKFQSILIPEHIFQWKRSDTYT